MFRPITPKVLPAPEHFVARTQAGGVVRTNPTLVEYIEWFNPA